MSVRVLTQLAAGGAALTQRGGGGASQINGSTLHHMGCQQQQQKNISEVDRELSISEMDVLMGECCCIYSRH